MPIAYDDTWSELNARLRRLERTAGGLPAVLAEIKRQQHQTSFIDDDLKEVERTIFLHPEDASKFFSVQYNPRRALRFKGAGRIAPPAGTVPVNNGCFLCRDNISWQQDGRQLGYELDLAGKPYLVLMNPFPLRPMHVVVASAEHRSQEWIFGTTGSADPGHLLSSFLDFANRTPDHFGYFNGVGSGASIPGHLHFHFLRRPDDNSRFPLEVAADRSEARDGDAGIIEDYPLTGVFWRGTREAVLRSSLEWLERWLACNADRLDRLTANLLVSNDAANGELCLYFVPRHRAAAMRADHTDQIGGLEVLGEFVFSSPADKRLLDAGSVDYFVIEQWVLRVRTPLYGVTV